MPKPIIRIPDDLRERPTLTIAQLDRILDLRRARESLNPRIDALADKRRALVKERDEGLEEETRILSENPVAQPAPAVPAAAPTA